MPRPASLPRWADVGGGAGTTPPLSSRQDTGWFTGDVVPAVTLNWYQNLVYAWILDGSTNWGYKDTANTWALLQTFSLGLTVSASGINVAGASVFSSGGVTISGGATVNGGLNSTGTLTSAASALNGTTTFDTASPQQYSATRTRRLIVGAHVAYGANTTTGAAIPLLNAATIGDPSWLEANTGNNYDVVFPLNDIGLAMGTNITGIELLAAADTTVGHRTTFTYWVKQHDFSSGSGASQPVTYRNTSGAGGDSFITGANPRDWYALSMSNFSYGSNLTSGGFGYSLVLSFPGTAPAFNPVRIYGIRITYQTVTAFEQAA